jgi:hypothetical protein
MAPALYALACFSDRSCTFALGPGPGLCSSYLHLHLPIAGISGIHPHAQPKPTLLDLQKDENLNGLEKRVHLACIIIKVRGPRNYFSKSCHCSAENTGGAFWMPEHNRITRNWNSGNCHLKWPPLILNHFNFLHCLKNKCLEKRKEKTFTDGKKVE